MTTRGSGGREAVSHYRAARRIEGAYGKFTLVEVKIDTGRTHQIRVHMASLGHPVAGDTLYGAPAEIRRLSSLAKSVSDGAPGAISLPRNFLHSAELELAHPRTGKRIALKCQLPEALQAFLAVIERDVAGGVSAKDSGRI
jgi:23S rRNA pseudouridine1911/1915/1917 synthase